MICTHCGEEIPDNSVVCPFCATSQAEAPTSLGPSAGGGASLDDAATSLEVPTTSPDDVPTSGGIVPPTSVSSPSMSASDSGQHGRFLPGTTVAGRYRIAGLLGRGGMGEVYRADDLKLGQQVALKFLPGRMVADAEDVQRLYDEVRMARKVSHPNVCRVFDVGETDGLHYVSMEYVDGEDLSSLLRRIGRLPEDKALEIARQLCAALGAAHDEGVLHRDLKPANIMIDGRGRVKLTDFGLAAVNEVRAGTPIYMAPEQLAGTEVSIRSDVYSLGLVLHEIFTGKRVFEADDLTELSQLHQSDLSNSLTDTSRLDMAVDRVIHRCLELEPAKRPASALSVAAALPGADPLAAALAAGETPSPEMVAEAGGEGSLTLSRAVPLLLFALIGAFFVGGLQWQHSLAGWVPMDIAPAVLEARATETLELLGYSDDFADTASGLRTDLSYFSWLRGEEATDAHFDLIADGRAGVAAFWWRGSPVTLVPAGPSGIGLSDGADFNDPPQTVPGMLTIELDTMGRLVSFEALPDRLDPPASQGTLAWAEIFEAMGWELNAFETVEPRLTPTQFADQRMAWEGRYSDDPEFPVRIEAAALGDRLVSLRVFAPHAPLDPPTRTIGPTSFGFASVVALLVVVGIIVLLLTAIFGGLYVAQKNLRSGRGDQRGARRLGSAVALMLGISWLLGDHTYSMNDINEFMKMLVFVGAGGAMSWALYLAVEPFMRRHNPGALIGWTRVIDGRLGDPLVARDVLIGCAVGILSRLLDLVPLAIGDRAATAGSYVGLPLESTTQLFSTALGVANNYVFLGLGLSFLYGLSYLAAGKRTWLAFLGWILFFGGPGFVPGLTINGARPSATALSAILWTVGWAVLLIVLVRLGILVFVVMATTSTVFSLGLPTLDFGAWYGSTIGATLLAFTVVAAIAFWRTVSWGGGLAEAMGGD
ncbi:MAG: protein kinase [Acidobacteria bacterium]|nr:protein kinase [Acidobacteriota bacterium]